MPEYWWCLTHERVEHGSICKADNRLGPYPSEAEARGWRERRDRREETWEEEDKRWHGERDDG
jgi:hypothetical protein